MLFMKKVISYLFLLIYLLTSCKKEAPTKEISYKDSPTNISEKISLFLDSVSKVYNSKSSKSSIVELRNNLDLNSIMTLDYNETYKIITVPLKKEYQSKVRAKVETSKYLSLIMLGNNNIIKGEVIEIVKYRGSLSLTPETLANIYHKQKLDDFSGLVLFSYVNKAYKYELEYKNGDVKNLKKIDGNPVVESSSNSIETMNTSGCIDWYLDTYWNGQLIAHEYLYTSCPGSTVYDCQMTRATDGNHAFEKDCGGGGGDDFEFYDNVNATFDICPRSFNYSILNQPDQYGGGWQVAAVNGVRTRLTSQNTTIKLDLPTFFFQLPVRRSNGQYYDPETAAAITSKAVEDAEEKVAFLFHMGVVDNSMLLMEYKKLVNMEMEAYGGKASQYSPAGLNIQTTKAVYGILGLDYFCW